uniref:Uncharacterized protein n=1 Tax=Setaria viridis TaxID=4556 RepID=A0A4U6UWA2_SETVI|nr:hypothetical protein SEVIR_4G193802v2 [Setaria viridis]
MVCYKGSLACTGGMGRFLFSPLRPFEHHYGSMLEADSLSYTSTISVALAVVFEIFVKLIGGQIPMPKLFPAVPDLASVWELFTAVPILVTAYVCHYNGMNIRKRWAGYIL